MTQPLPSRRLVCTRCLRPQRTCICRLATPIAHAVDVLIFQHPLEVANAKGSARLLHLCLPRSRLVVGEAFDEEELRKLLFGPSPDLRCIGAAQPPRQPVLLYPDAAEDGSTDPAACMPDVVAPEALRLVVLDGTWRKSRKMLFLNPLLRQLPRIALRDAPPSQYRIRKAHAPDQLSTLEATAFALMRLEQDRERYRPLLKAFNDFVAQLSSYS